MIGAKARTTRDVGEETVTNDLQKVLEIEEALVGPGGFFEMEEEEVLGEPMMVFKNRARSLRTLIEGSGNLGDKEYIVCGKRRITYAAHFEAVASVAKALHEEYGVAKGDRVAILAANNPEWIITFWATVSLGAIAVALNGWWVADEIVYGLEDSQPKVLIGDEKRLARLDDVQVSVPIVSMESDFGELWQYDPDAALSTEPIAEDDPACIL